jgi:paraquat-inducible protein B
MGKRANPAVVGAFVIGAVVLSVVAVAVFGSGRLFRHTHKFVVYFEGSVNGLNVGSAVKFKGVPIGSVADVMLNLTGRTMDPNQIRVPVIIEIDDKRIRERGGRADIGSHEWLDAAIKSGLRAQLNAESYVTGLLYVALDVLPDTPVILVNDPEAPYPEIPALPTTLEQVRSEASKIFAKLNEIDFRGLIDSLRSTVDGLNKIISSPDLEDATKSLDATVKNVNETVTSIRKLTDNLDARAGTLGQNLQQTSTDTAAAMRQAKGTMENVGTLLEPGSPLAVQLGETLADVSVAAQAVQRLADYLERNPGALLRGKAQPEEQ